MPQADQLPDVIVWPQVPADFATDGGLSLRRFQPSDTEMLLAMATDAGAARWTSLPQFTGAEEAREWIGRREAETDAGTGLYLVICLDGQPVGSITLLHIDLQQAVVEMGYWLLPAARGNHLAEQAARLLIHWVQDQGFCRMQCTVNLDNPASLKTARKLGFVLEGVIQSYGFTREGTREDVFLLGLVTPGAEAAR